MENSESDYSEDFDEEEVSSAAAQSSKPSLGSVSVQRPQRSQLGPGGGSSEERVPFERVRRKELSQPRETMYQTPSIQHPASQTTTKSKSTGAVGRLRTEDKRLSRRTQSFLPRRLQPGQKRPSKFAERSPARERQLSAMNRTVRTLQNKLSERSKRLEEVSRENRLLNRLQKRQDREWTKIQRQEDELPQTLQRHEQEVRALRKQLRKSHEVAMASQQRVGEMQDEVRRLSDVNHKLETLVGKKRLLERDQLTVQLEQLTQQLTDKENRITELERGLEASSKTHAQEMRGLRLRNKALARETDTLRDTVNTLQSQLKEKNREMDVLNIYTQRIPRNTVKPSPPSPPTPTISHQASQTTLSCPPFKSVSMQHRPHLRVASSQTDVVGTTMSTQGVDASTQTVTVSKSTPSIAVPSVKTAASTAAVNKKTEKTSPALTSTQVNSDIQNQSQVCEDSSGGGPTEAEKSKMLIQKLHQQTAAPGCKPSPSENELPVQTSAAATEAAMATTQQHPPQNHTSSARTTAEPLQPPVPQTATTVAMATTQQHPLQTLASATAVPLQPPVPQAESAAREYERKQLLLAKLMAIDEGSDPNYLKQMPMNSQKQPTESRVTSSKGIFANKTTTSTSSSSLSFKPDVIENMHQGKPAYASENDPFGSRTRLSSSKKMLGRERLGGGAGDDGRGGVDVRGQRTFMTEKVEPSLSKVTTRWGLGGNDRVETQPGEGNGSYKPSFGRRAAKAVPTAQGGGESKSDLQAAKPTITALPPPWQPADNTEDKQLSVFGGDSPSVPAARGELLPRRPKAEAAVMRSHDIMPGAVVSEPDDLEELVL